MALRDAQAIDLQFERAVDIVQNTLDKSGPIQTSYQDKLDLYSLYKQASDGNVQTSRPGMLDVLGRAKWDAWKKQDGLTQVEAKKRYVDVLVKFLKKYQDRTLAVRLINELDSMGGGGKGGNMLGLSGSLVPSTSGARTSSSAGNSDLEDEVGRNDAVPFPYASRSQLPAAPSNSAPLPNPNQPLRPPSTQPLPSRQAGAKRHSRQQSQPASLHQHHLRPVPLERRPSSGSFTPSSEEEDSYDGTQSEEEAPVDVRRRGSSQPQVGYQGSAPLRGYQTPQGQGPPQRWPQPGGPGSISGRFPPPPPQYPQQQQQQQHGFPPNQGPPPPLPQHMSASRAISPQPFPNQQRPPFAPFTPPPGSVVMGGSRPGTGMGGGGPIPLTQAAIGFLDSTTGAQRIASPHDQHSQQIIRSQSQQIPQQTMTNFQRPTSVQPQTVEKALENIQTSLAALHERLQVLESARRTDLESPEMRRKVLLDFLKKVFGRFLVFLNLRDRAHQARVEASLSSGTNVAFGVGMAVGLVRLVLRFLKRVASDGLVLIFLVSAIRSLRGGVGVGVGAVTSEMSGGDAWDRVVRGWRGLITGNGSGSASGTRS